LISMGRVARQSALSRALSLLCVFLIAFVGIVEVVHVHPASSKVSTHECSICAVAHAGVISRAQYRPAPVFVRTTFIAPIRRTARAAGFLFSLRIRPPPAEV